MPFTNNGMSRYEYMVNVVRGVRALGGSAQPLQIYEWLVDQKLAPEADLTKIQSDGGTRFHKEVRFARKELFDAGILAPSPRGDWKLSEEAGSAEFTIEQARSLIRIRTRLRRRGDLAVENSEENTDSSTAIPLSIGLLGPTNGPEPTDWTGEISRSASSPASTYLLRFGERDLWKVGHAQCLQTRLRDINRHVPHEILGEYWHLRLFEPWPTAKLARRMEAAIFSALHAKRTIGERLTCTAEEAELAWFGILGPDRRRPKPPK